MIKKKSLVSGIGNLNTTKRYYDNWSSDYDKTLNSWKYKVPHKSANILKRNLNNLYANSLIKMGYSDTIVAICKF